MQEWVSEQILNSTSAQIGYTVPLTSGHAGKRRTEDKSKTDITNTKHNPEKANNAKQQNKTTLVRSSFTTLGQETSWAYSTLLPSPHVANVTQEIRLMIWYTGNSRDTLAWCGWFWSHITRNGKKVFFHVVKEKEKVLLSLHARQWEVLSKTIRQHQLKWTVFIGNCIVQLQ